MQDAVGATRIGFDAIVLAGGRGSRLGGLDKARLVRGGRTLAATALGALADAARIVVVGPQPEADALARAGADRVRSILEEPRFGGPVPALAAGLAALAADGRAGEATVLVLAVDLVRPGAAVDGLVVAVANGALGDADALVALDAGGVRQPLVAAFRRPALDDALAGLAADGGLDGAPVRRLLARLSVAETPLGDACDDVDTPADAVRHGVALAPLAGSDA